MSTVPATSSSAVTPIRGKIIEAEIKVTVDPTKPLPLACAVYAVESSEGVWLCAYYGTNRSVFEFLPQKGAEVNEKTLGIIFHIREFLTKELFVPTKWEEFKKSHLAASGSH